MRCSLRGVVAAGKFVTQSPGQGKIAGVASLAAEQRSADVDLCLHTGPQQKQQQTGHSHLPHSGAARQCSRG